jgi:DNA-binding NarL/FixJ family response regulator
MAGEVRIVLLEDDAPTRERLQDALAAEPGFAVVAVGTVAAAREEIARLPPQGLVTDLELPDGHGIELTAEVRAAHPSVEILVISVLCDERSVVAAISAGASGYVVKDALPEDIAATVRQVLRGESPLSAAIARYLLRRLQPPRVAGAGPAAAAPPEGDGGGLGLTRRETDILWGIAKGMTYNEIADGLGISRKTVPNYIKSIYRKLEVNSRGEAVFEAISRKLIRL